MLRRLLPLALGLWLLRGVHLGDLLSLIVLDLADELGPLRGSVVQGHAQVRSEDSGDCQGLFILTSQPEISLCWLKMFDSNADQFCNPKMIRH